MVQLEEAPYEAEVLFSDPMPCWTIGLERPLRILDPRVTTKKNIYDSCDEELTTYKDKTFVGMLTLENRASWHLEWLQLLGGLGNLEELHGSFSLDAMLPGFEFRQEVTDWVVEHWPKMRYIEFYVYSQAHCITLPLPVQLMVERLPELTVPNYTRALISIPRLKTKE